jgi:glutathione synthase/RimK-type ligase-like ATP-grasp enzyme
MSEHIILVEQKHFWKPHYPDYRVVTAKEYLSDPQWLSIRDLRIINLCRTHRYLGTGYYCSLLAEARRHKVIPSIRTIQDLRSKSLYSLDTGDLDERVKRILNRRKMDIETTAFEITVIFGQCRNKDMQPFARELFELFRAPLIKVEFRRDPKWRLASIKPIALQNLTEDREELFFEALQEHMRKRWRRSISKRDPRYELAILYNPEEAWPPSDRKALSNFIRAAKDHGIRAELITPKDYSRLAEYDALFIRETTEIDHHTYRFSRKAASESMVVIDDPDSILRCTNKIYLAELLRSHRVPTPQTMILQQGGLDELERQIPYPVVLKVPDGSFSRGVFKVENRKKLEAVARRLFKESELLIAQAFAYTDFDWRVGILNRKPLYVCKYFMAEDHWQIINYENSEDEGTFITMAVEDAPAEVVKTALKAANPIGDGLYGVDLKETPKGVVVIEVNDNPSIDAGVEDKVLGTALYSTIMGEFLRRLELKRQGQTPAA